MGIKAQCQFVCQNIYEYREAIGKGFGVAGGVYIVSRTLSSSEILPESIAIFTILFWCAPREAGTHRNEAFERTFQRFYAGVCSPIVVSTISSIVLRRLLNPDLGFIIGSAIGATVSTSIYGLAVEQSNKATVIGTSLIVAAATAAGASSYAEKFSHTVSDLYTMPLTAIGTAVFGAGVIYSLSKIIGKIFYYTPKVFLYVRSATCFN